MAIIGVVTGNVHFHAGQMRFLEARVHRARVSFRCQRAQIPVRNVWFQQARQCKHCGEYHVSYIVTRASGGMADALASGASVLRDVGVQVPLRPQNEHPAGLDLRILAVRGVLGLKDKMCVFPGCVVVI